MGGEGGGKAKEVGGEGGGKAKEVGGEGGGKAKEVGRRRRLEAKVNKVNKNVVNY